jgi:hypothetical protein
VGLASAALQPRGEGVSAAGAETVEADR